MGIRIVIVDDDSFVGNALVRNLRDEFSSEVILLLKPEGSAKHTAKLVLNENPDIVIMDLSFSGLSFDGGHVIQALREEGFKGNIILFSGFIPEDKKTSLEACEVLAYIQKPNLDVLKETLKIAL